MSVVKKMSVLPIILAVSLSLLGCASKNKPEEEPIDVAKRLAEARAAHEAEMAQKSAKTASYDRQQYLK